MILVSLDIFYDPAWYCLQGNILYRFPSLQRTASKWSGLYDQEPFFENPWMFRYRNIRVYLNVLSLGESHSVA
jgi:hypothetical protein